MKIAFFTNNFLPRISGVAISVNTLKVSLEKMGVEVFIFAPCYQAFYPRDKEEKIIRIRSIRFWGLKRTAIPISFFNVQKINRYLKKIKPDLIHIHHPLLLGKFGLKKGLDYKIPVVFTFHTLYKRYGHYFPFNLSIFKQEIQKYILECANRSNLVIAPTKLIADYLESEGVKNKIAVMPSGIDIKKYNQSFSSAELEKFKKQLGIAVSSKVLLYVGRITPEKNIDFLIKVVKKIVKIRKDVVLIMVGDGILLNSRKRLTRKLKLNQNIIWTGLQPYEKLPLFYGIADLFLFPSRTDTQALVLYEALASGLPVVAIDSLASKAIIHNGKNGFIVPENIFQFARIIMSNLSFKKKKLINLKKEYSSGQTTYKTYELYQQVIKEYSHVQKKQLFIARDHRRLSL